MGQRSASSRPSSVIFGSHPTPFSGTEVPAGIDRLTRGNRNVHNAQSIGVGYCRHHDGVPRPYSDAYIRSKRNHDRTYRRTVQRHRRRCRRPCGLPHDGPEGLGCEADSFEEGSYQCRDIEEAASHIHQGDLRSNLGGHVSGGSDGGLEKFLSTEGKMGAAPDWYILITAARYLGVEPWELLKRPPIWLHWATMSKAAENRAERTLNERELRKSKATAAARG